MVFSSRFGAFLLGLGVMWLFDPDNGRRRRARVRDKLVRARHVATDRAIGIEREAVNRGRGVVARSVAKVRAQTPSDEVLVERVRAKLGHVCTTSSAIEVVARGGGCVELRGPILERDHDRVISEIREVHGVTDVDDDLEIFERVSNVPGLQGLH